MVALPSSRLRRTLRWLGVALLGAGLAALLAYGFAGWFGGSPFSSLGPAVARPGQPAVVILSGDMGFGWGMSAKIARRLADDGLPVIRVNSLAYFSTPRDPAATGALVGDAVERALRRAPSHRVVVIGQSFGADMLHVGLSRMAPALRVHVAAVVLVVPGAEIIFHASLPELFELEPADVPAQPTADRLDWVRVTCVYGAEEPASLCPRLTMPNVRRVTLPGGHRLNFATDRLYRVIRRAIDAAGITHST